MTWEKLNRKIWRMWKANYTLTRMAREITRATGWGHLISLHYAIDYLHNVKGIGFSRRQLRYALNQFLDDVDPGSVKEEWAWILRIGGYEYRRGKRKDNILSYSSQKMADTGISPGRQYNLSGKGELAPERGLSPEKGEALQEAIS